jgi:hypothetical protein
LIRKHCATKATASRPSSSAGITGKVMSEPPSATPW